MASKKSNTGTTLHVQETILQYYFERWDHFIIVDCTAPAFSGRIPHKYKLPNWHINKGEIIT
jgi:hypothetical protein